MSNEPELSKMPDRIIYRIRRTLWYQAELLYDENEQAKPFLRAMEETFRGEDVTLAEKIEKLIDDDLPRKLLAIVLKPYNPTPFHWLWNRMWMRLYGIKKSDLPGTGRMSNSLVMAVVRDFFLYSNEWIWSLFALQNPSGSKSQSVAPLMILSALMNQSSSSPTGTLPKPS